jgi:hypothetical protein
MKWDERQDASVDWAECSECKGRDFVSYRHYERQVMDHPTIIRNLPPELAQLFARPEREPITAEQAASEIFDL